MLQGCGFNVQDFRARGDLGVFQLLNISLSTSPVLSDLAHLKTQGRGNTVTDPTAISCSNTFTTVFILVFFLCCHKLLFQTFQKVKPIKA